MFAPGGSQGVRLHDRQVHTAQMEEVVQALHGSLAGDRHDPQAGAIKGISEISGHAKIGAADPRALHAHHDQLGPGVIGRRRL